MILKNCSLSEFVHRFENKKIFCFGAYVMPIGMCNENPELKLEEKIHAMADNDVNKQNKQFDLCGFKKKVLSAEDLAKNADENSVVLITSSYYVSIIEQLNGFNSLDNTECYVYPIMKATFSDYEVINPRNTTKQFIPKTLHYFWFGKNEKSELIKMCIESSKKYCPDYEIIEWNETNYDVNKNRFMAEAYKEKKWAFVSDYARLDILYQYGGIYMDTDVEVIRSIDDLLYNEAYFGFGNYGRIASGLGFGCTKNHIMIKELLHVYDDISFTDSIKHNDLITNTMRETDVFKKHGLIQNNKLQIINHCTIFPSDFFSPNIPGTNITNVTENTYSIHHNNFSWANPEELKEIKDSISKTESIICIMNNNA